MNRFRDSAHLIRLAAVFVLGAVVFVAVRAAVIPKSFGRYGFYRGDALQVIRSRPLDYAGHETCEGCHPEVLAVKSKGVHAHVNCESCHGPQASHADDPVSVKPPRPDVAKLCVRCHSENIAKPSGFPQVDPKEHAQSQACNACHQPHSPGFDGEGKK
jgi:predicted CXXCH cytochrome family protein